MAVATTAQQRGWIPVNPLHSMSEPVPRRLPDDFVWSQSGKKHMTYEKGKSFEDEGKNGFHLGRHYLGGGGQAVVSVVIVKGRAVARKSMRSRHLSKEAQHEALLLENITHNHIIQLVGTYTQKNEFHLLLYPIAECTLRDYTERSAQSRDRTWETSLKESFGCLANTMAFLHSKRVAIKHKDIKPTNILMLQGSPVLTDFGISNSFKDTDRSTSTGLTFHSERYAAPEVIEYESRNTSQDIFSLGLVFLDIYWALKGQTHGRSDLNGDQREHAYEGTVLEREDFVFAGNAVKLGFEHSPSFQESATFLRLIRLMTAKDKALRPTADTIWTMLTNPTFFGKVCGDCCLPEDVDKKAFMEWSALHIYVPSRRRVPFDSEADDNSFDRGDCVLPKHHPNLALSQDGHMNVTDWAQQDEVFHIHYSSELDVPAYHVRVLGNRQSGIVEAVRHKEKLFARKTIRISRQESTHSIENGIEARLGKLPNLDHSHILQVIGSYTTERSFSILMFPVCDYNLNDLFRECYYLRNDSSGNSRSSNIRSALLTSVTCLARALERAHSENVHHGDIKPQNILYKQSTYGYQLHVHLADFGTSQVLDDLIEANHRGPPESLTKRYASKESHNLIHDKSRADVFSLGCIFYEILVTILCAYKIDSVMGDFDIYANGLVEVHNALKGLRKHCGAVDGLRIPPAQVTDFADLIMQMTQERPEDRPSAAQVARSLGMNQCCYLQRDTISKEL